MAPRPPRSLRERGKSLSQSVRLLRQGEIRKILVLQVGPIGDTILSVPALKALRAGFPQAGIAVVATPRAGDVLRGLPYHDELRVCRNGFDLMRTVMQYRRSGFDLAVGLSNGGSWLAFLCNTRFKAGLSSPLLALAEPGAVKEEPSAHVVEHCLAVVRLLGAAVPEIRGLEIALSQHEREKAAAFLAGVNQAGPLVALHPGGHYFSFKRWPVERFASLADALAARGYGVVVVGGTEDGALAAALTGATRHAPLSAVGRLGIKETAALIAKCSLFIGNDSAPLHLAAAVGTPAIGLFGPTSPAQFRPFGQGHEVIYKGLPCSPCFKFLGSPLQYWPKCRRPACMEAIGESEVLAAALARLQKTAGAAAGEAGG